MPENPRKIRRRIQSVKNTQKITSAMKMVAAARLRRAEDRVRSARPYSEHLQRFINTLLADTDSIPHPLAEKRADSDKIGLLLITSDRGLCGSYNSNIIRLAHHFVNDNGGVEKVKLFLAGRKGFDYFRRRRGNIARQFLGLDPSLVYREIKDISDAVSGAFLSGELDKVYVASSRYVSPAVCRPGVKQLLPLSADDVVTEGEALGHAADFIFQPSPEAILEILFPKFLHMKLVLSLAESFASEQGQRMVAMTTATDNAEDMIKRLTLYYNKVRQAAITKELAEIVGGAEALK